MSVDTKGIVYVIDGAGGSGFLPFVMNGILPEVGFDMHHFQWSVGYMQIVKDLTNRENNRKRASALAATIRDYREKYPDRKIHVIAKSAGTAIALWAMADMPDRTVDRVVLLSPAVSPGFPLETALHAAREDVYSFWSPADFFFLDWGTSIFGTADGVRGKSAGLVGFHYARSAEGSKVGLCEVKWDASMISSFHIGDHSGTSMPPFIRKYVLPLLLSKAP